MPLALPAIDEIIKIARKCAKRVETWLLMFSLASFVVVSEFMAEYQYIPVKVTAILSMSLVAFALAAFISLRSPSSEVAREFMLAATVALPFVISIRVPVSLYAYPFASLIVGGVVEYGSRKRGHDAP